MEDAGLRLVAEGADRFTRDMDGAGRSVDGFGGTVGRVAGGLKGFGMAAAGVAGIAGGALVAGFGAAAASGFSLNNSLEQASAKINAFTKDAAVTADILDMVRERAASTPFAFEEMANSAAALIPVARASGESLEGILETSEILAASNPAEGLEGAAIALREAVSGDFVSLIERFNLPREMINRLKEEGLPNIEIVRQALQEMGFDYDLVSNLANTAEGRMSTFKDTLQGIAAAATQPLFEAFSAGLGEANGILSEVTPQMEAAAAQLGTALAPAAAAAADALIDVVEGAVDLTLALQGDENAMGRLPQVLQDLISVGQGVPGALSEARAQVDAFFATPLGTELQQGAGIVADYFANDFQTDLNNGINLAEAGLNRIAESDFGQRLQRGAQVAGDYFANEWPQDFQNGVAIAQSALEPFTTEVGRQMELFKLNLGAVANYVLDEWPQDFSAGVNLVVGFFATLPGKAQTEFDNLKSTISKLPAVLQHEAARVGQAIIDGIVNGIKNGAASISAAAQQAARQALDAAKRALGIQSPSQVMADEVGLPVAEGIAVGMMSGAELIASASTDLASRLAAALAEEMPAAAEQGIWDTEAILSGFGQRLEPWGREVVGAIRDVGGKTGETLAESLGKGIADAFKQVDDVPAEMRAKLGKLTGVVEGLTLDVKPEAEGTGSAIADGIAEAIDANTPSIADAARSAAQAALDAAKAELGISSPSRVMADEVGEPVSLGMAEGILAQIGAVTAATDTLSEEALKSLEGMADRARRLLEDTLGGIADFARSRVSAFDAIDTLSEQTAKAEAKRDGLAEKIATAEAKRAEGAQKAAADIAKLEQERLDLQTTAQQNLDPVKRAEATRKLADIETKLAERRAKAAADDAKAQADIAKLEQERIAAANAAGALAAVNALAQKELAAAQQEAARLAKTDPQAAADFLSLREKQIAELLKLQERYVAAGTEEERKAVAERIALLQQAQDADLEQLRLRQQARADDLADLAGEGKATGDALIDGIREAIAAGAGGLGEALRVALEQAIAAAKAAMGIASPSKVAAKQVGAPLAAGIAAGFMGETAALQRSLARGLQQSISPLQRLAAPAPVVYGGSTEQNVTINGAGFSLQQLRTVVREVLSEEARSASMKGRAA